jgi:hypothetical protein
MSDAEEAKAFVDQILDDIARDKRPRPGMALGFTIISTVARMAPSRFPEGAEHVEVELQIELPVAYGVQNGRAALPARRENLDGLRARIEEELRERGGRLELTAWDVLPEDDPEPKAGPEKKWTVSALIRERRM